MKTMDYLNLHKQSLLDGKKLVCYGKVYWANMVTREVYAHSIDEELQGSISGYKVADISNDMTIEHTDK